jgi:hypothetical protein
LTLHFSNDFRPTPGHPVPTATSPPGPKFTGDPDFSIGGVIDPSYYSKKGAFNGSGIAFAGESFVNHERGIATVYFQHHTGDIRWVQLNAQGNWVGGSKAETVATDAKNSTPISTVAYALNDTTKWHIFYISQDGYVRQKTNSNVTNIWEDGFVNNLNLKAFDADAVGLQACWYGNFYGDDDAKKFPTASGANNTEGFVIDHGMHLWYASDEQTFQQYGIYEGQQEWVKQKSWPNMNGHAGVGCYSWLPGSVTYAMFVNLQDTVEIWWKDTNNTLYSTEEHPIMAWTNGENFLPVNRKLSLTDHSN